MSFSYRLSAALIAATIASVPPEFAGAQLSAQQVEEIDRNECNPSGEIDFNEAIRLNPNDADSYYKRGFIRSQQRDKQGAINDFQKASELYQQQGNTDSYRDAQNAIRELQKELEVKLFILGTYPSITNYRAYLI